jgi:hypothetical protein
VTVRKRASVLVCKAAKCVAALAPLNFSLSFSIDGRIRAGDHLPFDLVRGNPSVVRRVRGRIAQ